MMNQNMELGFVYKVVIQMYSLFLDLSQQSLEHYHGEVFNLWLFSNI